MRIALITHALPPEDEHGISRYICELANALVNNGHHVDVISGTAKPVGSKENHGSFNVHWVPSFVASAKLSPTYEMLKLSLRIRKKLYSLHRNRPFDVVEYPNFRLLGLFSVLLGLPGSQPAYVARLSSPSREFPKSGLLPWRLSEIFEAYPIRNATGIISNTSGNLKHCQETYDLDLDAPSTIILHGLPEGGVPKLHYNATCSNVGLFVGRIEARKGFDILVKAWELVLEAIPDAKLIVAGKDCHWRGGKSFLEYSLSEATEKTLVQIDYMGFVDKDKKETLYRDCDIFVAPSRYESFGLIFLEAMRYGKPVVSCNVGGIPEVVRHEKTGILVSPNNVEELAAAIIRLFSDDEERFQMARQAVADIEDNYSQTRVAAETESFYRYIRAETSRAGE